MNLFTNQRDDFDNNLIIAGIDEAGRGPLAGPVVVAAVILKIDEDIDGLNDSKKLSAKKRNLLFTEIINKSLTFQIVFVPHDKIDEINILNATLLGMSLSVKRLPIKPDLCIIDGNKVPNDIKNFSKFVVKGDAKYASIAAASILAKVSRDRFMEKLHKKYPQYNFSQNKGYPTKEHINKIYEIGITPYHRMSFKPIKQLFS